MLVLKLHARALCMRNASDAAQAKSKAAGLSQLELKRRRRQQKLQVCIDFCGIHIMAVWGIHIMAVWRLCAVCLDQDVHALPAVCCVAAGCGAAVLNTRTTQTNLLQQAYRAWAVGLVSLYLL